jgi:hypothetical protein
MTSCILTVIKNEQEYLDEWIKYHLDLGIDHIFIFEDMDSDSHKDITEKYGDRVSLNSIFAIFNRQTAKKAIALKSSKNNTQPLYFKTGLLSLKLTFLEKYDWCFAIDNDEFITLENENDGLQDVLSLYSDYDAFVMQWKCYGANGYVNKPNYEGKGLIGTYVEEMKGSLGGEFFQTKTCYRLNKYEDKYYFNIHQPSDSCNFCRTDFSKDRFTPIYDKIFIRHYITKSWEEYLWKRKNRGYFCGLSRTYDNFFAINPDMNDKKEELLKSLKNDDVLVVMPYVQRGSQGKEIELALSCWKKFCKFKFHFVVIGEFDNSLTEKFPWVEFVPCPSVAREENQYTPHLDIQMKLEIVMRMYKTKYDGFIRIADDIYSIKPFDLEDITTPHYHSKMIDGSDKLPLAAFFNNKWKTKQLLEENGLPCINYTAHYPVYYEFSKLREIWNKFNMREESYVLEDVYFNYFEHEEPVLDDDVRFGVWSEDVYRNGFEKAVSNPCIKFTCNSVEGWSEELENSLNKIIKE